MAFRTVNYTDGIWMDLESDPLGLGRVLPLVLLVVVYNDQRRWAAQKELRDPLTPARRVAWIPARDIRIF